MELKNCIACGAQLPAEASFCPFCTASQIEREPRPLPKGADHRSRLYRYLPIFATAAVLLVFGLFVLRPAEPINDPVPEEPRQVEPSQEVYMPLNLEGEAELNYPTENGNYRLIIALGVGGGTPEPAQRIVSSIAKGTTGGYPAQLYVFREGDDTTAVTQEFASLIKSVSIVSEPQDGSDAVDASTPQYDPDFPDSVLTSHLVFTSECRFNKICWTLQMKNGDTLRLTHILEVSAIQAISYHLEDQTDQTFEDLQAFITDVSRNTDPQTHIIIYLPPVTYYGSLKLENRSISLHGLRAKDGMTTFIGPQTVLSSGSITPDIQNVRFIAENETGIRVNCGVRFYTCEFLNCQTGIAATDGGSIGVDNCVFQNNEVGILYDTDRHGFFTNSFSQNIFRDNDTAFWLKMLPNNIALNFVDSEFYGNAINIKNDFNHPIVLQGAIFE